MSRPKANAPSYCLHRPSGRAYVTIDGRMIYLGKHGSAESRVAYDRTLAEWLANGRRLPVAASNDANPSSGYPAVSVLIEAFWRHAQVYYTKPVLDDAGNPVMNEDGTTKLIASGQLTAYRYALRPLRRLYGGMKVSDFGCPQLEAIREAMINPRTDAAGKTEAGWARTHVNRQIGRIKHVFGWGVTKKLVPASVHDELERLPGLRKGKTRARETRPVRPVDESRALKIVPHVSKQVGIMLQVQLLTGMRSTELCIMRPADIDRTVSPWIYRPTFHKTQEHDIDREIPIGPRARALIEPYLDRDPQSFLFSPAEAEADRLAKASKDRKTPVQPSQVLRSKQAKRRKRRKQPGRRYDRASYYKAIRRGCELAFELPAALRAHRGDTPEQKKAKSKLRSEWFAKNAWHPHQARHRTATDLRKQAGTEAAQVVLGHTSKAMTLRYAEADVAKAHKAIEEIG
ncbi:MAG TPA: tyrosine-type recombinase/integrase [Tepidisphaeraceae bacterium]|nr:tyrosine-type recombinase/integrase [Tepidisphaeraceae bacterium]